MRLFWAMILMLCAAAPAVARDPSFAQPIDCSLGDDCFILNLVDADPGAGVADYTCGPRAYDTHKGTDFALSSHAAMDKGVDVLAAAPGRVRGLRDGVEEAVYGAENAPNVDGIECGNGLVVDHGGGWISQYCHLRKGSVAVEKGQSVRMGQVLGQVGLSGKTQYPHLHISFRKDGEVVDPFAPNAHAECGGTATDDQLWQTPIAYPQGGIVSSGFAPDVPSYEAVKSGAARHDSIPPNAPTLVGWSFVYGPREGDILRLQIDGPTGVILEKDVLLKKTQVLAFRAMGKKTKTPWPIGPYAVSSWLIRGGSVVDAHRSEIEVR